MNFFGSNFFFIASLNSGFLSVIFSSLLVFYTTSPATISSPRIASTASSGPSRVFESQDDAVDAILGDEIVAGDVVVIRYEGPKGGPGMQEMLYPTSYLKAKGLGEKCALITDGRFSGGTSGLSIGHISPEAASKGYIALIKEGDIININIPKRSIDVDLLDEELDRRRKEMTALGKKAWKPHKRNRTVSLALQAYALLASSASDGAVRQIKGIIEDE